MRVGLDREFQPAAAEKKKTFYFCLIKMDRGRWLSATERPRASVGDVCYHVINRGKERNRNVECPLFFTSLSSS